MPAIRLLDLIDLVALSPTKPFFNRLLGVLTGQHVLLLDDIFDTGHTLRRMTEIISTMQPASLKSAVLLWKMERNETQMKPDYVGFKIPNQFVVGYGLDYDGQYRNLPDVCVLPDPADQGSS